MDEYSGHLHAGGTRATGSALSVRRPRVYPATAARYTEAVIAYCLSLASFPQRGLRRDDIRHGLRITHFRSRTVIAFVAQTDRVQIIGIFHSGRDYAAALSSGKQP